MEHLSIDSGAKINKMNCVIHTNPYVKTIACYKTGPLSPPFFHALSGDKAFFPVNVFVNETELI